MKKIEQIGKIIEVKKIDKVNKKGEKITNKSVKITNKLENIIVNLKGNLAKDFEENDRGKKAEIIINFDIGDKN